MNREMALLYINKELPKVPIGTVFLLSDLFPGYIWKDLRLADRIWLGTTFLSKVQENEIEEIIILEKTSSNKQKYKKI
ncbi:hypothetical protein IEQ_04901 [Bacillus cereus BAG6X1-2]|nr:hypothetical protein IEQ_04901 [Bacillus cereus BAG6X1-2]